MQSIRCRWIVATLALVLTLACRVPAAEPPAETFAVAKTYNNAPFEYRSRLLARAGRVPRLPADLSVAGGHAAAAEQHRSRRLLSSQAASGRACQISGGHLPAHPRRQRAADRSGLLGAGVAGHSGHRVQAALLRRARRGQGARGPGRRSQAVRRRDRARRAKTSGARSTCWPRGRRSIPERIGITGISLGGIIAATAAGAEPRLYRAGLILAGGDLLAIIHHARETRPLERDARRSCRPQERAEIEAKIAAADPLRFAPALRDRAQAGRVLMINAAEDEVIPRAMHREAGRGAGHRRSRGVARRAGPLHGDGRIAPGPADDGRFLRPGFAGGSEPASRRALKCPARATTRRAAAGCALAAGRGDAGRPSRRPGRCHYRRPGTVGRRAPTASRSRPACGWSAARRAVSCSSARCRRSARSPWARAAFPGCSPAGRRDLGRRRRHPRRPNRDAAAVTSIRGS